MKVTGFVVTETDGHHLVKLVGPGGMATLRFQPMTEEQRAFFVVGRVMDLTEPAP